MHHLVNINNEGELLRELALCCRLDLQLKSNSKELIFPELWLTKLKENKDGGNDEEERAANQGSCSKAGGKANSNAKSFPWGVIFDEQPGWDWDFSMIVSQKRNEWLQSQIKNLQGRLSTSPLLHALPFSSGSHKQGTKPVALLFIVHRGRSTLSWMGWIRYVLLLDERRWTSVASRHKQKRCSKLRLCCWKRSFINDFKCHL